MIELANFPMNISYKKIQFKIFDIVIIFIFIFLAITLFFVLFRKQSELKVVIKVNEESLARQVGGVPNWFSQFLHAGMKEIDVFGRPMAEIKTVKTYFATDQRSVVYLTVSLKTVYSTSSHQHTYKGKVVSIGSTIQLPLDNLLVNGLIVDVDGSSKTNLNKIYVQARIINLDPVFPQTEGVPDFVADAVKEGDVMNDSLGNPVIKILKKTVEDAKIAVTTANGDLILQRHPMRKDVFLDLEIWAEKIGDRNYLFGDTNFPIIIDSRIGRLDTRVDSRSESGIPFYTDNNLVILTITKINSIR